MVSINKDKGDDYWSVWNSGTLLAKYSSKKAAINKAKRAATEWDDWIEVTGPRGGHDRIDVRDQPTRDDRNSTNRSKKRKKRGSGPTLPDLGGSTSNNGSPTLPGLGGGGGDDGPMIPGFGPVDDDDDDDDNEPSLPFF